MPINWSRFKEIVDSHQRFLLTSHVRSDCDALGSELAMAQVLEALGKEVTIVNGEAPPPFLSFIDPDKRLKVLGEDVQPADLESIEVIVILDTSAWAQLGPMADVIRGSRALKVLVDHHVGEDDLGAEKFKDVQAEATGCLVLAAADQLGVALTPQIATPLFAAVSTDTGWFRFLSVSGETYRVGARLVDAGAVPQTIYTDLYEQDTLQRLKLRGRILARTEIELEGRLAHTAALGEDFEATGAHPSDTEDVINLTLSVAGVEVAVILVQRNEQEFKISFRSRSKTDCSQVAARFGGGGHQKAAGAMVKGPFEQVKKQVLDAVREAMRS